KWTPGADDLEQIVARYNDPANPLKIIIVTAKLLTGFDAPILYCQYLDKPLQQVISNIEELKNQLEPAIAAALAFFPGVDRTVGGYEGLVQAQSAIADEVTKDAFGLAYSVVSQLWEALSPDPMLAPFRDDYRWLTDVYESVRPSDITGRLVWHALGAKTVDLINEHVVVEVPRDRKSTRLN